MNQTFGEKATVWAQTALFSLAAVVACGTSTTGPPSEDGTEFGVTVALGAATATDGCDLSWYAKASDPDIFVEYTLCNAGCSLMHNGAFRDEVRHEWTIYSPGIMLQWSFTADLFNKAGDRQLWMEADTAYVEDCRVQ